MGPRANEVGLDSVEKNLIGHWKFDDAFAIDSSTHQNDMVPPPEVGP